MAMNTRKRSAVYVRTPAQPPPVRFILTLEKFLRAMRQLLHTETRVEVHKDPSPLPDERLQADNDSFGTDGGGEAKVRRRMCCARVCALAHQQMSNAL